MFSTFGRLALISLAAILPSHAVKLAALQADAQLFSQIPFDYIIIGGGTAGIALATRLTEDPTVTVGVIEAGLYHEQEPVIDTPSRWGQGIGSDVDWAYVTEPQPGVDNLPIHLACGRMVGGGSGLNFMAWTRPSKPEYDAWETLGNGPTWNWDSLLPYLKKTETWTPPPEGAIPNATTPSPHDISTFHGNDGPIQVSFNTIYGDIIPPFVRAMNAVGIRTNSEPDNGDATGLINLPRAVSRKTGSRSYSAATYFDLSGNRPNLHVLTGAHASKIIFSNSAKNGNLTATGVQYLYGLQTLTANAKREVIVSAGAVRTPQILELSGIGNKDLLNGLGIETLLDMPQVGENFQDQPLLARDYLLRPGLLGMDSLRNNVTLALEQLKQYETTNDGFYGTTVPVASFLPFSDLISGDLNTTVDSVHQQLLSDLANTTISPLYSAQIKIQLDWLRRKDVGHVEVIAFDGGGMTSIPPAKGSSYLTVLFGEMHPFGRGSIHINTTNPIAQPVLDPKFLALTIDSETFVLSGNFTDQVSKQHPLVDEIDKPNNPPAGADFLEYARANVGTIWHPIGTAPLAPLELGGVVDPTLTVYGTNNVRIVDASVIPLQIAAHTQTTVYAIAEKAADIIKAANGHQ